MLCWIKLDEPAYSDDASVKSEVVLQKSVINDRRGVAGTVSKIYQLGSLAELGNQSLSIHGL